ncbi:MAG: porin [Gammaproteobacteria bacterium]|nr:porin [Gammaproteobacteria bacterium]MBU1414745.1 porin [Gammaproteobacteria bacterium]
MQKKLIAVAVAGLLSSAAFAESNVTISGVADAYYARLTGDNLKSINAIGTGGLSGSRIALNGAEDLGNGLKAIFQMELGFNLVNNGSTLAKAAGSLSDSTGAGNGITTTRQSYVGLAGSFGAVVAGRLQAPGYYVGKFDALASSAISPQAILSAGAMNGTLLPSTIAPSNAARANNAVAYLSPNFSGFSAVVAASSGPVVDEYAIANGSTTADENATVLGLNYAIGPVTVGFVHHNIQNVLGVDAYDTKENMIGATYNAGFLTVAGSYQTAKVKDTDTNKLYQIGVVVPVGAGNIHVAYGKLNMKDDTLDAKSTTIAYTHGLSKRTTAYAGYNKTDNESASALGLYATAGSSNKGMVVGLRHTF